MSSLITPTAIPEYMYADELKVGITGLITILPKLNTTMTTQQILQQTLQEMQKFIQLTM